MGAINLIKRGRQRMAILRLTFDRHLSRSAVFHEVDPAVLGWDPAWLEARASGPFKDTTRLGGQPDGALTADP